ncbi:hypothetical protein CMI47_20745 [Candidatus Pacearchaeota archaeon]|nr:hypothetical protein [Candidatus Pacearchaeota archaeon]|tara:strand:+ start:1653 stop:2222 length:570 start_codon:yes stop_codon:yes gene_type:complete
MAIKQKVKAKKGLRKKFFEVETKVTGAKIEVYAFSPEEVDGQVVKLDLSRSLRGKNLDLKLKVKADGEKLVASPVKATLLATYIRKMMRRGVNYVEDSFEVDCRDARVRIKPFLITRKRVSRAVRNALSVAARKYLEGYVKVRTAEEIFSEIMANKIQKDMSLKLKKIYPLSMSEIRVFEVVGEKGSDK